MGSTARLFLTSQKVGLSEVRQNVEHAHHHRSHRDRELPGRPGRRSRRLRRTVDQRQHPEGIRHRLVGIREVGRPCRIPDTSSYPGHRCTVHHRRTSGRSGTLNPSPPSRHHFRLPRRRRPRFTNRSPGGTGSLEGHQEPRSTGSHRRRSEGHNPQSQRRNRRPAWRPGVGARPRNPARTPQPGHSLRRHGLGPSP